MLIVAAWVGMLLMSDLVDILANSLTGGLPSWLMLGKLGWTVVFLGLCLVFKPLRPLWQFALVMIVFFISIQVSNWLKICRPGKTCFNSRNAFFFCGLPGNFLTRFDDYGGGYRGPVAFEARPQVVFPDQGLHSGPDQPVRWLGIKAGESWRTFGWIFGGVAALLVLIPTVIGLKPSGETLLRAAGLLPAVLLFAGINAFNEEMYYRASMLSTLPQAIGKTHALLISITFFGLRIICMGHHPASSVLR